MSEAGLASDFEQVDRALKMLDCDISASECHGLLCGMLCTSRNFQVGSWLEHTLGYRDEHELHDLASTPAISQLFKGTLAGMDADDFSFSLLLPEDSAPLGLRVQALGAWCRGFLSGCGLSDMQQGKKLGDEIEDFLRDMQEIGKVDPEEVENDTNEEALFELQEYTRMGALMVREEFRAAMIKDTPNATDSPNRSVH
ncbi:MAG: UPF0149 family protein [Gammaproteobacteria bacterium]